MNPIFLNADLGESEPPARTRSMMRVIDLANIACGGHAGSIATMRFAVAEAAKCGVKIGAHPGLPDRERFGRSVEQVSVETLECLVISQVSALATVAKSESTKLHHVKLHGALYHAAESNPLLAATYLTVIAQYFPRLRVIARIGGEVEKIAPVLGVPILREAFADRGYDAMGGLIPRGQPGALLTSVAEVKCQVAWLKSSVVSDLGRPDTICVHGDTADALVIARAARSVLRKS
ncbi:MAG: 5-oxoprolinase subunit PxpA [Chthoniobacterales bacterium]